MVREGHRFPVFGSADKYAKAFKSGSPGQVQGAPKKVVDFIKAANPYKGANNPLWRIHQLDIVDKHKLLVPVGMVQGFGLHQLSEMNTVEIEVFVPNNALQFPLEDSTEIYRVPARGSSSPVAQMHMYPHFTFGVAFGEGEIVEGEPLVPTLHEFTQFIEGFIESFVVLFSQEPS
jgi:hypothetical protein